MQTEQKTAALPIAQAIAQHLNRLDAPGWTAAQETDADGHAHEQHANLTHTDGTHVRVTTGNYQHRGRLALNGYPWRTDNQDRPYKDKHTTEITVAMDCPPERAAKEIVRRLLPGCRALADEIAEHKAKRLDYGARVAEAREQLAAAWPMLQKDTRTDSDAAGRLFLRAGSYYGDFKVSAPDTGPECRIEVSRVPLAAALRIVAILAEYAEHEDAIA